MLLEVQGRLRRIFCKPDHIFIILFSRIRCTWIVTIHVGVSWITLNCLSFLVFLVFYHKRQKIWSRGLCNRRFFSILEASDWMCGLKLRILANDLEFDLAVSLTHWFRQYHACGYPAWSPTLIVRYSWLQTLHWTWYFKLHTHGGLYFSRDVYFHSDPCNYEPFFLSKRQNVASVFIF